MQPPPRAARRLAVRGCQSACGGRWQDLAVPGSDHPESFTALARAVGAGCLAVGSETIPRQPYPRPLAVYWSDRRQ
jgi:hypothetical protein